MQRGRGVTALLSECHECHFFASAKQSGQCVSFGTCAESFGMRKQFAIDL